MTDTNCFICQVSTKDDISTDCYKTLGKNFPDLHKKGKIGLHFERNSNNNSDLLTVLTTNTFFLNNPKFKQSPLKFLICQTISKQFAGANKRQKLNNPLREQAKTLFLQRKPKRNAHFWTY